MPQSQLADLFVGAAIHEEHKNLMASTFRLLTGTANGVWKNCRMRISTLPIRGTKISEHFINDRSRSLMLSSAKKRRIRIELFITVRIIGTTEHVWAETMSCPPRRWFWSVKSLHDVCQMVFILLFAVTESIFAECDRRKLAFRQVLLNVSQP